MESCVIPGLEHEIEFKVVAFGQCQFQCKICGLWLDELEDGLTG